MNTICVFICVFILGTTKHMHTIVLPPTDVIVTASDPKPVGYMFDYSPTPAVRASIGNILNVIHHYAAQLPITLRQIFYRLVAVEIIGKTEQDYKRMCEHAVKARRAGLIDFSDIRDDGIQTSYVPGYNSVADLKGVLCGLINQGVFQMQLGQPIHQMVVCETAGMVPQLERVAAPYGVQVFSGGGFWSVTGKKQLADIIEAEDRPTLVWHIGDHDPSGQHLYQNLATDVAALAPTADQVSFQRLAVTEDQIADLNLPQAPAKKSDNRSFNGTGTVQAEAIPPNMLATIVGNAINQYRDQSIADEVAARSEAEAEQLKADMGL